MFKKLVSVGFFSFQIFALRVGFPRPHLSLATLRCERILFWWDLEHASQVKSSAQRAIRSQIMEQYPALHGIMEQLIPKKAPIFLAKWFLCFRFLRCF